MTLPTRTTRLTVAPFNAMQKEFDAMLSQLFNPPAVVGRAHAETYTPTPVDVREDADRLYVEADLPGFAKDEVELTLEDGVLTLVAEHKPAVEGTTPAKTGYLLNERRPAKVRRSFKLPPTVGDQVASATLEHGVLTVTLAKREEVKPRKIAVQ